VERHSPQECLRGHRSPTTTPLISCDAIALLSRGISVKLAAYFCVIGHLLNRFSMVRGPRSRSSTLWPWGLLVTYVKLFNGYIPYSPRYALYVYLGSAGGLQSHSRNLWRCWLLCWLLIMLQSGCFVWRPNVSFKALYIVLKSFTSVKNLLVWHATWISAYKLNLIFQFSPWWASKCSCFHVHELPPCFILT